MSKIEIIPKGKMEENDIELSQSITLFERGTTCESKEGLLLQPAKLCWMKDSDNSFDDDLNPENDFKVEVQIDFNTKR